MTDVVALATELLAFDSTTDQEGPAVDFVARWLIARGWNVTLQEVSPGRSNIWASRQGHGVTLSTHLDTVPPYVKPSLEGERLYGRGACDAKGIVAAMLVAADALVAEGEERVDLLFVVGEEGGSDGARAANGLAATSRFLINGEPTESTLASGAKGSLRVTLRTRGRAAHSAYPQLGASAILPMLELLQDLNSLELPHDPILGRSTLNVGVIRGGAEANIVPERCEAEIMVRLVGPVEPVQAAIERVVGERAEVRYGSHIPAQHFQVLPEYPAAPVAYTSDIPLLSRWGTPLLYGPGSISVAHTPDEHIETTDLREAARTYAALVRALLGTP